MTWLGDGWHAARGTILFCLVVFVAWGYLQWFTAYDFDFMGSLLVCSAFIVKMGGELICAQ